MASNGLGFRKSSLSSQGILFTHIHPFIHLLFQQIMTGHSPPAKPKNCFKVSGITLNHPAHTSKIILPKEIGITRHSNFSSLKTKRDVCWSETKGCPQRPEGGFCKRILVFLTFYSASFGSQTLDRLSNVAASDHVHRCRAFLLILPDSAFAPSILGWDAPHAAPTCSTPWTGLRCFLTGPSLHQETGQQTEGQALQGGQL